MDKNKQCRCPVRPYYTIGSFGSGSNHESMLLRRWDEKHGQHPYAKVRDELANALQAAEKDVGSGEAVLDMVADIFNLPRTVKHMQELGNENARMRRILADTLGAVRRMGAEDETAPVRGWSTQLQAIEMCEVPRMLGEVGAITSHEDAVSAEQAPSVCKGA